MPAWAGTFTFSGNMDSQLQRVRNLLGDIDSTDVLLYDEQYAPFLTGGTMAQSNDYLAGAMAASLIASKLGRQVQSLSAGGSSVVFDVAQGRAKFFRDLAQQLRATAARLGGVSPYVGGTSIANKQTIEEDDDRVVPAFTRETGDYPGTSPTALATEDYS